MELTISTTNTINRNGRRYPQELVKSAINNLNLYEIITESEEQGKVGNYNDNEINN